MTLYATDLDGTLLRSDMTISDDCASKLNNLIADSVLFTFATARSWCSAAPLLKKLKLNAPAVTFNGVFVIDPRTGEHIFENDFSEEALRKACDFFVENNLAPLVYAYIDGRERVSYLKDRLADVSGYVEPRRSDKRLRAVKSYDELFSGRVFYFTLFNPKMDIAQLDAAFSRENGFSNNLQPDTYDKSIMWYEIFSANAGKAAALLQVKNYLGADRLVCFGDNTNDLSMLLAADVGIAMSNANDLLKANADDVIGTNDSGAVADYIFAAEKDPEAEISAASPDRFSQALGAAMIRIRGMHGSVGTQNEKLIHAALKNYYVPDECGQEVKIGSFFADAVCEDGIYEIQTRALYRLREKLKVFTEVSRVNVVYPIAAETRTVYISADTGEVVKESAFRKANPKMKIFEELYSIRDFLGSDNLCIIIAKMKTEKRVYFSGDEIPDMRLRSARKRVNSEKVPLALLGEIRLGSKADYAQLLPKDLPQQFTKKEFCTAAKESCNSLRLEVLRAAGIIEQTGKQGRSYLYRVSAPFGKERDV